MKSIYEVIERRRQAYDKHAFIEFLRDDSLTSEHRLSYAPFSSYFVLCFAEFNRNFLRDDDATSPEQDMVNRHADEDSTHFAWFFHDMKVLGYDFECTFTDVLRFLWTDLGKEAREMSYYVISVARDADADLRLVIIEAVEAMGNVWLTATVQAARNHPEADRLVYFGAHHLERETGHAIGSAQEEVLKTVLSPQTRARAEAIVHGLFDRMEAFNTELLRRVGNAAGGDPAKMLTH